MRVLVTVSPRMYRDAVALSIHRNRPGLDVRAAPPEEAERELAAFLPHLLVHNDTAPVPEGALAGVPWPDLATAGATHTRHVPGRKTHHEPDGGSARSGA